MDRETFDFRIQFQFTCYFKFLSMDRFENLQTTSGIFYFFLYLFKVGGFKMPESRRMQIDAHNYRCIPNG